MQGNAFFLIKKQTPSKSKYKIMKIMLRRFYATKTSF